jgi:predicted nucleotidyltransferase
MATVSSLEFLRQALADAPAGVVAAYLFGSVAQGTAGPSSDVDLGLLLRQPPLSTLEGRQLDYQSELERRLRQPVQIVILNDAPPDLAHRVLRTGRLLLERDRRARIRFEVHTRNMYFDLLPILTEYRRRVLQRASGSR